MVVEQTVLCCASKGWVWALLAKMSSCYFDNIRYLVADKPMICLI
jgi:hypothetical protein